MRKLRSVALFHSALLVVCVGCSQPEQVPAVPDQSEQTLIKVDSVEISVEDFERTYVQRLIATGASDDRKTRYLHVSNLIDSQLLYREAQRRGLADDSTYLAFEERERRKTAGGKFFKNAFLDTLEPQSDEEIRNAFALSKRQAIVRHLFYRDSASANAAYRRLLAGTPFIEEAQLAFGTAAFDSMAGYLGPIRYFQVDDAFAETAFGLEVGSFSEPVRSRVGYHIILLEDILRNPILTESEFQTKREGVASQMRLRKRRLDGDRFVQSYMEGLEVTVNPEGIEALAEEIELLEHSIGPDGVSLGTEMSDVVSAPTTPLRPQTPLLRYRLNGEEKVFTAEQYAFWLEDLPFAEARHRTAASVGRALRNEVFAQEGIERGFDQLPGVEKEIEYQARIYLANRLRYRLKDNAPEDIDEALLEEVYRRAGLENATRLVADYWAIPFSSREEAEIAGRKIAEGVSSPDRFTGYTEFVARPVADDRRLGAHVRRTPLQKPAVTRLGDGTWVLLEVLRRTDVAVSMEEEKANLAEAVAPMAAEYQLLKDLRATSEIELDTLLFEQIMMID